MIFPDIYLVGLNVVLCTNPLGIAQAAAAILLTVRGTPVLYYGQEIGMVDNEIFHQKKCRIKQ